MTLSNRDIPGPGGTDVPTAPVGSPEIRKQPPVQPEMPTHKQAPGPETQTPTGKPSRTAEAPAKEGPEAPENPNQPTS